MEGLTLEKLQVIIDANTKGIRDELAKVQSEVKKTTSTTERQTSKITSMFKKMAKTVAVALSITAIVSFGKSCIQLGSDLQEVQNVVDVTFGSMNEDINSFAKNAISQFGLSELSAKQYTSTMGSMLKSMGIVGDEMLVMSKNLTGLAGDMASFYNLSGDEAFAKIRAGISGETEPLKQLGINMSVANLEAYALSQGITKAYSEMEQAEQVMLRYNYLMQTTADAQGDFARTSGSWANQTKILSESFNSVKASIGQGLINVFTPVLRLINEIIPKLQIVADMFKNFTSAIFGDAGGGSDIINDAAASAGQLSSNMEDTATAANNAKKALSGIDKLNNISSSSGSGADGSADSSSAGSVIDTTGVAGISNAVNAEVSKIKEVLNTISTSLKTELSGAFNVVAEAGKSSFAKIQATAKNTWKTISGLKTPMKTWFTDDVTKFFKTVVESSAKILAAQMNLFTTMATDVWNKALLPIFENFMVVGLPMITQFATELAATTGLLCEEILNIATMLWDEGIAPLLDVFTTVWIDTMNILGETWATYGSPVFDGINDCIQGTVDLFEDAWNDWIKPIWDGFVGLLDQLWKEHLQNKEYRDIVAYDNIYLFNTDVSSWYNELTYPIAMKDMLISLCTYIGVELIDFELINGTVEIEKTIDPADLKGITVLKSIAELNGGFFRTATDGKIEFVDLNTSEIEDYLEVKDYRTLKTENFTTNPITRVTIRSEESDVGASAGEGDNAYIIQDNFLLYGSSTEKLKSIASVIYKAIKDISYIPYTAEHVGLPYLRCGCKISYKLVNGDSFIGLVLQRTLSGTQGLKDVIKTQGKKNTEETFSVEKELIKLKGKANLLSRTIEENRLEIINVEEGLHNEIVQQASNFDLKISQIQAEVVDNPTIYTVTETPTLDNYPANTFHLDIYYPYEDGADECLYPGDWSWEFTDETYAAHLNDIAYNERTGDTYKFVVEDGEFCWEEVTDTSELGYIFSSLASINATTDSIGLQVEQSRQELHKNYYTKVETEGQIKVASDSVKLAVDAEVKRATGVEAELNATLELKVNTEDLVTELNMSADNISIKGDRFELESTNTSINKDGKLTTTNGEFTGVIKSSEVIGSVVRSITNNSEKGWAGAAGVFLENGKLVFAGYESDSTYTEAYGYFDTDERMINLSNLSTNGIKVTKNIEIGESLNVGENVSAGGLIKGEGIGVSYVNGYFTVGGSGNNSSYKFWTAGNAYIAGNLACSGTKNRMVDTANYGNILMNAYETSTPMFGDVGTGCLDEAFECIIFLDDIFLETIDNVAQYTVFLQKYGKGDIWVDEIHSNYFIVKGDTAGLSFAWEVKGKQKGYAQYRLETETTNNYDAEYQQNDNESTVEYGVVNYESTTQYEKIAFENITQYEIIEFEDTSMYE